jgi:class 3 adenylate cyclase
VKAGTVEAFLGKVEETAVAQDHSRLPVDTAFRTIFFTDLESSVAITQKLGDVGMMDLLRAHDAIIRSALASHAGREIKHTGDGIMACFTSVTSAIACAIAVQTGFASHNQTNSEQPLGVRIGLSAGEPSRITTTSTAPRSRWPPVSARWPNPERFSCPTSYANSR